MLAKRVNFSASYIDNGIIFENSHVLLTTFRFFDLSEAPNFLIKHAFIAGVVHFLHCVGTSMAPAPAAISGHGASVIGQLKCPCGQVGAVPGVQTTCWNTVTEAEERDRKCKKRRRQRQLRQLRVQKQRKQSSPYCKPKACGLATDQDWKKELHPRPCAHPQGAQVLDSSTKTHQGHVDARD